MAEFATDSYSSHRTQYWSPDPVLYGTEGLVGLVNATDTPLLLYHCFWTPTTEALYRQQGMNFSFVPGVTFRQRETQRETLFQIHPEDAHDFFKHIFGVYMKQGVMMAAEVDFLNWSQLTVPAIFSVLDGGHEFLDGLASAALSHGISHQLCMSLPSQIMDTLLLPAVTNARASPDNTPGRFDYRWRIGYTSLLMWPLDVQPFFDNTWTESVESPEYGTNRTDVQLQVIVSILSAGPHGIGDALGHTNATRVLQTCTQDGSLLHADKPATPIDAMFSPSAPFRPAGEIWQTHVRLGDWLWRYVLAVDVNESFALHTQHLWPPGNATASSRDDMLTSAVVMPWHSRHACAGVTGCVRPWEASKLFSVQTGSEFSGRGENGFDLLVVAPTVWTAAGHGIALLGETAKVVSVSGNRFFDMARTESGLGFELRGAPGETVHLSFVTFATPTAAGVQRTRSVRLGERGTSERVVLPDMISLKTDDSAKSSELDVHREALVVGDERTVSQRAQHLTAWPAQPGQVLRESHA